MGVSYDSDPEKAIHIIKEVLEGFQEISKKPPPQVGIQEFGDSLINIGLCYQINLSVYRRLKAKNIEIPFPQRGVYIVSRSQDGPSPTP